jgi:hypothetical protein
MITEKDFCMFLISIAYLSNTVYYCVNNIATAAAPRAAAASG